MVQNRDKARENKCKHGLFFANLRQITCENGHLQESENLTFWCGAVQGGGVIFWKKYLPINNQNYLI